MSWEGLGEGAERSEKMELEEICIRHRHHHPLLVCGNHFPVEVLPSKLFPVVYLLPVMDPFPVELHRSPPNRLERLPVES